MQINKGDSVIVFCANYFYAGKLEEITHDLVWLAEPSIVYETGAFTDKKWRDAQRLPCPHIRVERSAIESMGRVEK